MTSQGCGRRPLLLGLGLLFHSAIVLSLAGADIALVQLQASIDAAYKPKATADDFHRPSAAETSHFRLLIRHLHETPLESAHQLQALTTSATQLGFTLDRWRDCHRLAEQQQRRGRGIYFIRPAPLPDNQRPVIVQAPHARNDKYTERLAAALFLHSQAAALHVSSISRWTIAAAEGERHGPADVCHNTDNFFHAATQGSCDALTKALILQLHGYADDKHPDLVGKAGVLSNGSKQVDELTDGLQRAWDPIWPRQTLTLFGRDAKELGATTNVQGRWLRRHSDDHFLHLELSVTVRKELLNDPEQQQLFATPLRR